MSDDDLDRLAEQVDMASAPPAPQRCASTIGGGATWCCEYHAIHSDDEVERDLASAREQALNSVTALRGVKLERDKAEAEVERLKALLAEHVNENLALHRRVSELEAQLREGKP